MPEPIIQKADQYIADAINDGKLTPKITEGINTDKFKYDQALNTMYSQKYNSTYSDFDQFKAAYQSQYGDPFKKKEQIKPIPTGTRVQSFQPTGQRIQQPIEVSMSQQEKPSGTYVKPLEGTQVSTFQPSDTRKQVSLEESQDSLKPQSEQEKQQELYSSGLLEKTGAIPQTKSTKPAGETISSESTSTYQKPLTFEEAKQLSFANNTEFGEYLKPLNKAVYDALPQAVRTLNNIGGLIGEQVGTGPAPYTFEEHRKAYEKGSASEKAAMWASLIRPAQLWHDFNEEYMTATPEVEQSIVGQVAGGLGQGITMLAGAGELNMLTKSKQVLDAAKYANALSKSSTLLGATTQAAKNIATQPATYIAASQVFNQEFDDAYNQTGDSDTAFKSALINTVGSAGLEAMPIMSFMGRLDKATGGGVKQTLINGFKGGLEEATTEVLQQALSNTVASNLYDETRTITDGMVQSGEVGGLTGFALNILGASLGAKLRNTTDPYEAQEIKKAQDYVQTKKESFDKEQDQIVAHMENQLVSLKTTEMQKQLNTENITTEEFANIQQTMQTMPNAEVVTPKTVGITNKINDLLIEKQEIYQNVLNVEQQEKADARSKSIDAEIRSLTNTIGEIYANPSKKQIEENDYKTEQQVPGEERIGQEPGQAKPIKERGAEATETSRILEKEKKLNTLFNLPLSEITTDRTSRSSTNFINNFLEGNSLSPKGYSQLDIPTRLNVFSRVLRLVQNDQIFNSIVPLIPVDVMNELMPSKFSSEELLHNKPMLISSLSRNNSPHIVSSIMEAIKKGSTSGRTKAIDSSFIRRRSEILNRALGADELIVPEIPSVFIHGDKDTKKPYTEQETIQTPQEIAPQEEEDLTDPEDIAKKYHEERTNPVHISPQEKAIAEIISSGVSKEGVRKQGDINKFNNSMARSYFKEGGNTIDQVAQQASTAFNPKGDGNDISPEDVWDFMNKYPQGPDQIDRPAGNPRLKELATKYEEITGKQLNKTVAKKIAEAKAKLVENIKEDPNSVIEKYTDEKGNVKLDELESDISALPFLYDLNEEETQAVADYVKESRKADRTSSESTGAAQTKSEKPITIADKSETIREIKEKKLTHIQGVAMGSGVAKGTYLSTEKGNRYQGRGKKFNAEVEVENPYTTSENNLNKERGDILKSNIDKFTEIDFEGAEIPKNPTIDDLSNSGTEKLADLFTKNLQEQGYDSMYFPESKTQEGELVVFDKSKVKLTEDPEITDAMIMPKDKYLEKYPEGNYEEARAEYTKNTENLQEANKKGEAQEGVILMQKGGLKAIPLDTRFKNGTDKLKQAWIKATKVGGGIPFDLVFNYSYIRKNTISQKIGEINNICKEVEKAINQHLGGKSKVTKAQLTAMDQVLHGEVPAIALPSEVLAELGTLRSTVDALSLEMKNSGMLTDSMQAVIDKNMGVYLNRSYKKWNDPVWKENVPEDVMNKAVTYLKNEYIKYYRAKYEKTQEAFKNKSKRLRDFRTTIANKQAKVDENNERLVEYKSKHDEYIAKLDQQILKAKKRPNKEQVGPDLEGKNKKTKKEKRLEYLQAVKDESISSFNSIYAAKESQLNKQNAKIQDAITKAENAAYNLQQRNYPKAMQEALDKFTSPDDGEISALINQILYAPADNINPSGKAGAISGSFLKQRSERLSESPEIRALMGEYTDPYINFLTTANKMITSIQNYNFQKQLKKDGMGVIFSDKATGDFHRKIEGDAWKGLTEGGDVYTTELFEDALKELNGNIQQDMSPGMKAFRAIVSYVKVGKTAASTPGAVANYISNVSNIVSNAWNPLYAAKKIATSSKSELAAEFADLKKLGILGQSISGRELADRIKDTAGHVPFEKYLDAIPGVDVFSKGVKATVEASKKVFEVGDEYARVIGFYSEVERYRTAHPEWTEAQLRDNAAKIVANNSPTYDLAYPWVKNFRDSPWFSTFATFPAEIYRTTINQGYQIKKDLSDPKTRSIGIARLAGVMTSMGFGAYQIMEMATTAISGDDDDEKDLRLFVPEYSKANPLLFYRKNGEEYTYTDAGRFTYHNNFVSPIIAFSNGNIEKEEFDSRIYNSIGQMLQPFTDINIVTETGADVAFGYKSGTDEKIYSENDSNVEKLLKISAHIGNKLEPTNVKVARSYYDLVMYGKTRQGSEVTLETAALSTIGVKSRVLNITKQYSYQFYKQKEQGDSDKNTFERSYKNARSDEEKAHAIEIYKTQVVNQINKMSYLYHAALRQGGNPVEINKHTSKMPAIIKIGIRTNNPSYEPEKAADALIKTYIKDLTNKK